MPEYVFTQENLPTRDEFSRLLEEGRKNANPLEDLLMLERKLLLFEQKYNLSSADHFAQYQRGERGDSHDAIRWTGYYRVYLNLKKAINETLDLVSSNEPIAVSA